jgi:hypothetical protein
LSRPNKSEASKKTKGPEKLKGDLRELKGALQEHSAEGGRWLRWLHREYPWAVTSTRRKGQRMKEIQAAYRMRMLTLTLWNDRYKTRLQPGRSELELDVTNNTSGRGSQSARCATK